MNIKFVTLTGVDEQTDIEALDDLCQEYPVAEFAILYSPTKKNAARYPSFERIMQLLNTDRTYLSCSWAVHLCGQSVKQAFQNEDRVASILSMCNDLNSRVQLNFNQDASADEMNTVKAIQYTAEMYPNIQFIVQDKACNASVISKLVQHRVPVSVLCDSSGGNGIKQAVWPIPTSGVTRYGYAGGLGPDNIMQELKKIAMVVPAGVQTWVDMESSLRVVIGDNDIFSVTKCESVLNQVYAFMGTYA